MLEADVSAQGLVEWNIRIWSQLKWLQSRAGPAAPISGRQAYQLYIDHTLPFLNDGGGDLVFLGNGGSYSIGPEDGRLDIVMLVKRNSLADFFCNLPRTPITWLA